MCLKKNYISNFISPQSLMMATFFTNGPEAECAASAASSHRHCHGFVVRTENENPLRNILIRGLGIWFFECLSWRDELELESGIGDLRILCGKSYRVSRPLTPDPYLLTLTSRRKCQPVIKRDITASPNIMAVRIITNVDSSDLLIWREEKSHYVISVITLT